MSGKDSFGDHRWRPAVPGYELIDEVGRGGFGTVFRAVQRSVDREVALKVVTMALGDDAERRFRSECRSIGQLSWHPNIVPLYDAGTTDEGTPYLVMELMPGGSLGDRLRTSGPFGYHDVIEAGVQVADALNAAHVTGVLHRDVKPDNCFIDRRGIVRLGDFGIATLVDETRSATGSYAATLSYAAPELFRGQRATTHSDVYALGATLYTLLTGRAPFAGEPDAESPMALMWRIANDPIPPIPATVPPELAGVIMQALQKDPGGRQPSVQVFHDQLSLIHAGAELTPPALQPSRDVIPPPPIDPPRIDPPPDRGRIVRIAPQPPPPPDRDRNSARWTEPITRRRAALFGGGVVAVLLVGAITAAVARGPSTGPDSESTSTKRRATSTTESTTTAPTTTARPVPDAKDIVTADVAGFWHGTGIQKQCQGSFCDQPDQASRAIWFAVDCSSTKCEVTPYTSGQEAPYAKVHLTFDGAFHRATGRVPAEYSYKCGDVPLPTSYELRFESLEAVVGGEGWRSGRIRGTYKVLTPAGECEALHQTWGIDISSKY